MITVLERLDSLLTQGLGKLRLPLALIMGGKDHASVFQQSLEAYLVVCLEIGAPHLVDDDVDNVLPLSLAAMKFGAGNGVGAIVVDNDA